MLRMLYSFVRTPSIVATWIHSPLRLSSSSSFQCSKVLRPDMKHAVAIRAVHASHTVLVPSKSKGLRGRFFYRFERPLIDLPFEEACFGKPGWTSTDIAECKGL
jgi:hypothetical protein